MVEGNGSAWFGDLIRNARRRESAKCAKSNGNPGGRAPGLDRSFEGAVSPRIFLDDVTAKNDLPRIDGIPGAILDRFNCAVDH
jgi:hypothetical protein